MPGKEKQPNHVSITIDGDTYSIHPGQHTVISLRNRAKVPKENEFSIFRDGEWEVISNDAKIDIAGGEVFASNQPSGGAS